MTEVFGPSAEVRAKVVVVGKVTSIEPKTVKALPPWGGEAKVEFQVAFSNGAPLPWRLLEIHRSAAVAGGPRLLRMGRGRGLFGTA